MSKKRFVEFYLTACLKAATAGNVTRLGYIYYDMQHNESVVIQFANGYTKEIPVTGNSLTAISQAVLDAVACEVPG